MTGTWWSHGLGFALGAVAGAGPVLAVRRSQRRRQMADRGTLDALANEAEPALGAAVDPFERVLLPGETPIEERDQSQLFELYKLMVQTSEALVARRQGTNTFFLTANGLLLTAIGLVVRQKTVERADGLLVAIFCLTGIIISWSWRSLLISYGQLNKGKFAVILHLERTLPAAVFDAEWEALQRGRNPSVYRSFTQNETRVPVVFMTIYVLAAVIAGLAASGWLPRF